MRLSIIRQLWGIDKPWDDVLGDIAASGYDGVEVALPFLRPRDKYAALLEQHGLQLIPMIFTTGSSVDDHIASFRSQLEEALRFGPIKVTCHDGRDAWTERESAYYYRQVLAIEAELGALVAHETHRGRILYNPWTTSRMLSEFDQLRLCCDFSHWVCVCERLIDDQEDIVRRCAERAIHVHGRVGYAQGPQVPDPRAPEYEQELLAHERWWDTVWEKQRSRSVDVSTFTPEFGPPPYMQTDPYTNKPVADLWTISNWMADRQSQRFEKSFARTIG